MDKGTTQAIKGIAILIMIMHHFLVFPFFEVSRVLTTFGQACKICVAIYAVLSGYGYFFVKEKTIEYGIKKIWGLCKIYWISLFTLFMPMAIKGGWEITPWNVFVQLFGLLPNLNWFAWYVFFYVFCMLVMPVLCKYKLFRFEPIVNLGLLLFVPYVFEVALHMVPNYKENMIIHDLFSCFLYLPCFLVGYWMAENKIIEKSRNISCMNNILFCAFLIILIFILRSIKGSILGLLLDVIYAPVLICLLVNFTQMIKITCFSSMFNTLGMYSTGMWFFHAVFFSTYVCDLFKPILLIVSWPPLMYVWLVVLSLAGAFFYQKILDGLQTLPKFVTRSL